MSLSHWINLLSHGFYTSVTANVIDVSKSTLSKVTRKSKVYSYKCKPIFKGEKHRMTGRILKLLVIMWKAQAILEQVIWVKPVFKSTPCGSYTLRYQPCRVWFLQRVSLCKLRKELRVNSKASCTIGKKKNSPKKSKSNQHDSIRRYTLTWGIFCWRYNEACYAF